MVRKGNFDKQNAPKHTDLTDPSPYTLLYIRAKAEAIFSGTCGREDKKRSSQILHL